MQRGAHTARLRAEEEETGVWVKLSKVQQRLVIRSLMFFVNVYFYVSWVCWVFLGGFKSLIFLSNLFYKVNKSIPQNTSSLSEAICSLLPVATVKLLMHCVRMGASDLRGLSLSFFDVILVLMVHDLYSCKAMLCLKNTDSFLRL